MRSGAVPGIILALDARTLVLESALDGIAAVALAGVYSIGVGLSAVPIVVLQGAASLRAAALASVLPDPPTDPRVLVVARAGALLVAGIGVNLILAGLGLEDLPFRSIARR
jgi:uncharacterized protein